MTRKIRTKKFLKAIQSFIKAEQNYDVLQVCKNYNVSTNSYYAAKRISVDFNKQITNEIVDAVIKEDNRSRNEYRKRKRLEFKREVEKNEERISRILTRNQQQAKLIGELKDSINERDKLIEDLTANHKSLIKDYKRLENRLTFKDNKIYELNREIKQLRIHDSNKEKTLKFTKDSLSSVKSELETVKSEYIKAIEMINYYDEPFLIRLFSKKPTKK